MTTQLDTIHARHGEQVANALKRVEVMLRLHNSNCLDEDADVIIAALSQHSSAGAVAWQFRRITEEGQSPVWTTVLQDQFNILSEPHYKNTVETRALYTHPLSLHTRTG